MNTVARMIAERLECIGLQVGCQRDKQSAAGLSGDNRKVVGLMAWGIRILIFIGVLMLLAFTGLWAALCVASDEDDRMEGCLNAARQKDSEPD